MEFALKTAFINTFPTPAASPATCVPPSTCPFGECALGHGQGRPLVWARCPRETLQSWPRARGTGSRLFQHRPPWLSSHLDTHWAGALGTSSLPAPSGRPTLCTKPEAHAGASPATPRPTSQVPTRLPPQPCPRQVWPSPPGGPVKEGTAWPCPSHSQGRRGGPARWRRVPFTYGVSVQQPLEVIEGADRVVTQHLVELLRNGVPLPGRHMGSSELGVRAFQPRPSGPQHRHNPP